MILHRIHHHLHPIVVVLVVPEMAAVTAVVPPAARGADVVPTRHVLATADVEHVLTVPAAVTVRVLPKKVLTFF